MAIMFPYPLSGVAYASLFPLERLARVGERARARARAGRDRRPGAQRRRRLGSATAAGT